MTRGEPGSDPATTAPTEERAGWARWLTRGSLVVGIIALIATVATVGPGKVGQLFVAIGPWFAVVIAIEVAITLADAAAIRGFLGAMPGRPRFGAIVKAQLAGRAINAVTPLATLGEATKVGMLSADTSAARATAAIARTNLSGLGVILASIVIGAPVCAIALSLPSSLAIALWVGAGVGLVVLVGGVVLIRRGMLVTIADAMASTRLVSRERVARWRTRLEDLDRRVRGDSVGWSPAGWVVASRLFGLTSTWVVLSAVGHPPGIGVMAALATAGTLIGMIASVVPMGLGLTEAGIGALFAALGTSAALGVTTTLSRRVTAILYTAVGLPLLAAANTLARTKVAQRVARKVASTKIARRVAHVANASIKRLRPRPRRKPAQP